MADRTPRRIKAVDRALDVLETLRRTGGSTVTEVADEAGLSPGTAHTYLATLQDRGYVDQDGNQYRLGMFALPLGEHVRTNSPLYRAGKRALDDLAAETDETSHLVVASHGKEIPLYERFGAEAVGEGLYEENRATPKPNLHCSAAGKAILAHMTEERRESILNGYGFAERTEHTITDAATLRKALANIRDRGVAFNDEEQVLGLRAVGAPIIGKESVEAAVSLSAPISRLEGERFRTEFPRRVRQAANIVQVNLATT
jgi:DNA-binding IclR family transcriptional regulator